MGSATGRGSHLSKMITREFETQYSMRQANNSMMKTVGNTPTHLSPIRNRNANLVDFYSAEKEGDRRAATQMKKKENVGGGVTDEVSDYIRNQ